MTLASSGTDSYTPTDWVTGEKDIVTNPVVVASGEGVVARYAVMGVVTATGRSKLSLAGAVDGSQVPDHILVDPCDATAADAQVAAYFEGQFNPDLMVFGTGHDADSVKQPLRDKGIYLRRPG